MLPRWKQTSAPAARALSIADAKAALRVVDTASVATQANRSIGTGASQLLIVARIAGSIGNQYACRLLVSGNNTALSVVYSNGLLTINAATNGMGTATSTVNDVIAEIYATAEAAAVFDATAGSGAGTGVVISAAQANLTGGVDSGDQDAYIGILIDAAVEVLEARTSRAFINRPVVVLRDDWGGECIELPVGPLYFDEDDEHDLEVNYYDYATEELTELDAENYFVDGEDPDLPIRMVTAPSTVLPMVQDRPSAVRISFTAGYGAADTNVPRKIRQCISFLVCHWYLNAEPVVNGTAVLSNKVPFTFEMTLNSFRLLSI